MTSYLWKNLSEKEKVQIKEDAKKLILEFGGRIDSLEEREETFVERDVEVREEGGKCEINEEFRKIMLENAPKKNQDFIIGERGAWVE
ncbi:MAG: hypothetical protein U9Q06_04435 [Nanoarchaeota archaeon]|nr:hypothetical protein [Nanoarchaeota archaeon]